MPLIEISQPASGIISLSLTRAEGMAAFLEKRAPRFSGD
jgi:hypothetical protein